MLFMGIDVGTQGVRAIVSDSKGGVVAEASCNFSVLNITDKPRCYEQRPLDWWNAAVNVLRNCTAQLKEKNRKPEEIVSLAIDGTSGTILAIDENGQALTDGIMYNDMRSEVQTAAVHEVAGAHEQKLGLRFNASFSLCKLLWLRDEQPEIFKKAWKIIHQTDYIVGKLCGCYDVTDYSNALKTGYDLVDEKWPSFFDKLGVDSRKLPRVEAPGSPIAPVNSWAAELTGLSPRTMVVSGATDGYASALSVGAVNTGNWASIIGTTFVLKGVSDKIIIDPTGASYCHKLPGDLWLTGGASNVGGKCLNQRFDPSRFAELDQHAAVLAPTGVLIYPLTGVGERYPFVDQQAKEFIIGNAEDEHILFTALMEGVGYTERLAFHLAEQSGCPVGPGIYTTGGACRSPVWLQIRADILNKKLLLPQTVGAAMGAVLLAASRTGFSSLKDAAEQMVRIQKTIEPRNNAAQRYQSLYGQFFDACRERFAL
ncbi:carbohydrate kinase [Spirochaetia bacterium]|nr:carbohydrate kinase [Spirochaetia bacterium]